jgi:hypothetical protein
MSRFSWYWNIGVIFYVQEPYISEVCMYVYQIYVALISCSAHIHERFNNIISKNYGEKGASLEGSWILRAMEHYEFHLASNSRALTPSAQSVFYRI